MMYFVVKFGVEVRDESPGEGCLSEESVGKILSKMSAAYGLKVAKGAEGKATAKETNVVVGSWSMFSLSQELLVLSPLLTGPPPASSPSYCSSVFSPS